MKAKLLVFSALLLGLLAGTGAYSSVQAQSAEQVYARLQTKYRGIQSVQASFTQTMTSEYSDETATARGTLFMQGSKYRVETAAQTLVTDGKVTWVYMPADKQVLVNDYVQDETTFSLNDFFFKYADRYAVTGMTTAQIDGQKHFVLTLKPKENDTFFTEVTLSMRDRDALVTRLQVLDVNGTRLAFTLSDIQVNPRLNAGLFTFQPPSGVEVVDLRS